jgi:hypothetical protein
MQLSLITLASLASVAIASASVEERDFWPAHIPLSKRAVSGAEYQCHANCGMIPLILLDINGWVGVSFGKEWLTGSRLHHPQCPAERLL